MRFGILGPLEVWGDGEPVRVPEAKVRVLLAALLLDEGRPVTADTLIDDLWGEHLPAHPTRVLRAKLSQLRGVLDKAEPGARDRVLRTPGGYRLRVEPDEVDSTRFRALVERARGTDDRRAAAVALNDGLALWRGDALAGLTDTPRIARAALRLDEERLSAFEELALARLDLGEHHLWVEELGELVDLHPLRERLCAAYMRALYRSGRQAEALGVFDRLRHRLKEELGASPGPETAELHARILRQDTTLDPADPGPLRAVLRPRTNLPAPVDDTIGREADVERIRALMERARLITLTGAGGVGKTRLSLEVAAGLDDRHPDGLWFVELGTVPPEQGEDPGAAARVAEAVVAVTGARDLVQALSATRTLLILDNCEHVVESVAALARELLRAAPHLRLLVTSREPLGIDGEHLYEVRPLGFPGPADPADARSYPAVRLFASRASAGAPGFTLGEDTASTVASICRRLDGLPLALELAANRVRALGVRRLADGLDDRFRLLAVGSRGAPGRQRTLRAVIDWSWELLGEPERTVLRRLSVHAEGCTPEGAEAVVGGDGIDPDEVVEILARLVERSLAIAVEGPDGIRYRLLETIAAYAREHLEAAGEADTVRLRHLRHLASLAATADPLLRDRRQHLWLRRLDEENADLRAAEDTAARAGDADTSLRLALDLVWYRYLRGRPGEAHRSLSRALDLPGGTPALRAVAGAWRVGMALMVNEPEDPVALVRAALADRADQVPEREWARVEWFLGTALLDFGELQVSGDLVERSLAVFRREDDRWGTAAALCTRAWLLKARGRMAGFEADGRLSLELFGEIGDRWGRLQAMPALGSRAEIDGDYPEAARLHREGLRLAEDLGLWSEVSYRLSELGRNALLRGEHRQAEDFHERARRLAVEQGDRFGERFAEFGLGLGARREGRLDRAERYLSGWLDRVRGINAPAAGATVLAELGFVAEQRGDADTALRLHDEGLTAAFTTGSPRKIALALEGLAGAWALAGLPLRAARLLGAASAARASVHTPLPPAERWDIERVRVASVTALGEEAFARGWERGAREPLEETVERARRWYALRPAPAGQPVL
ncbi:BTAD domain-containing putative transcriptional regulator [Nocardiopsis lambiniae]|uniref:BTAD domain-containing putative transcriptional regulator n=1 Tax=Nocardiopsis lambiniae TaxID=3075539 RepID=A0ABU2MBM5_9ACTN|nr:BTAD domain-containing putative transcriptional regulator [Nocardiopsis sp. DSM 44743]MDT0329525.1 BTAD domain-containing putative transcriptional regulator [Nocardiopsis sp. DSM 44743]